MQLVKTIRLSDLTSFFCTLDAQCSCPRYLPPSRDAADGVVRADHGPHQAGSASCRLSSNHRTCLLFYRVHIQLLMWGLIVLNRTVNIHVSRSSGDGRPRRKSVGLKIETTFRDSGVTASQQKARPETYYAPFAQSVCLSSAPHSKPHPLVVAWLLYIRRRSQGTP